MVLYTACCTDWTPFSYFFHKILAGSQSTKILSSESFSPYMLLNSYTMHIAHVVINVSNLDWPSSGGSTACHTSQNFISTCHILWALYSYPPPHYCGVLLVSVRVSEAQLWSNSIHRQPSCPYIKAVVLGGGIANVYSMWASIVSVVNICTSALYKHQA